MLQTVRVQFLTHSYAYSATAVAVVILAVWLFGGKGTQPRIVEVRRGEVKNEVTVTGRVRASQDIELAFERSGTVSRVFVDVGTHVVPGQTLVMLSNGDIAADRDAALGNLQSEQAKLDALMNGARPEQLAVNKAEYDAAVASASDAQQTLIDKYNDAYTKADDAIHNQVDQLLSSPRSASPTLNINIGDVNLAQAIEQGRVQMETILSTWRAENVTSQPEAVSERARGYLVSISQYLEKVAGAVNQFSASASYSQTTVDGYRSSVSTARTNVNTAIVNLSTALQGLRTADNSLELALRELQLAQAPARSEDIAGQQARVTQAQAQLDGKQVSLGKTVLTSPIYAIVTRQDAKVGQSVTAQVPLVTLISSSQYEMEANVPEADIARLKVGQTAKVTLDAYSSDVVFDAHVTKIDPAETMIDGVPTYKVTFQFDKKDERLRSGMTANLDVLTEQKENVLAVPSRAVYSRDGKKYVRKYVHSTFVETEVVIGIRGSDGYVEVLSGLSEGELVENGSSTSLN